GTASQQTFVKTFYADGTVLFGFLPYSSNLTLGVSVAAGHLRNAFPAVPSFPARSLEDDVIAGIGDGGGGFVRAQSILHAPTVDGVFGQAAFGPGYTGSARVGAVDANNDGRVDVLAASGAGSAPQVSIFDALTGAPLEGFADAASTFTRGTFA